jgi:dGTPase
VTPADPSERWVPEPSKATPATRSPYERDRARVLHSAALRRLAAKTQVVGVEEEPEDGVPRTRLTHSLECAQIGRELAGRLGADPDVVDAACLAHDLGHPPFGHNGESALDAAAAECGGFEGNAQSLRELTRLETKVVGAGLNLTRATLDAACKYPWPRSDRDPVKYGVYADDVPVFTWIRAGAPDRVRSLEATIMDWADDVAYSVHDLEDGVRAGLVDLRRLSDPGERAELVAYSREFYGAGDEDALGRLRAAPWWPEAPGPPRTASQMAAVKTLTSELIARLVRAALAATRTEYGDGPLSRYDATLVVPPETRAECAVLKAMTAKWVMGRSGAAALQVRQRQLLTELIEAVAAGAPDTLEPLLAEAWKLAGDAAAQQRVVIDQVARLTDLSAVRWHARLVRGDAEGSATLPTTL